MDEKNSQPWLRSLLFALLTIPCFKALEVRNGRLPARTVFTLLEAG
jgi:hypothetical protein